MRTGEDSERGIKSPVSTGSLFRSVRLRGTAGFYNRLTAGRIADPRYGTRNRVAGGQNCRSAASGG